MKDSLEADLRFLDYLGSHLGLLAVEYVFLDKKGKDTGQTKMQTCSGFFVVLDDQWYFVTAGHVFHRSGERVGLKQAVDEKAIRITRSFIADYFGPDAKPFGPPSDPVHLPTIEDFGEILAKALFVNDDVRGLDFAFVPLRPLYVESVTAMGVKPLTEPQWQPVTDTAIYVLVGFPDEEKTPSATTSSEDVAVRPASRG